MKKHIVVVVIAFLGLVFMAFDLVKCQLPSVVVNSFQTSFRKVADVEWSQEGVYYKVEFETDMSGADPEAWFDCTGRLVKYNEEISRQDLPKSVVSAIQTYYEGYRVDDIVRITEGTNVQYQVELKSALQDWKVCFDAKGIESCKIVD